MLMKPHFYLNLVRAQVVWALHGHLADVGDSTWTVWVLVRGIAGQTCHHLLAVRTGELATPSGAESRTSRFDG